MIAPRTLLCLVFAATATAALPVAAQTSETIVLQLSAPYGAPSQLGRSYLGLNVGKPRYNVSCASTSMLCDDRDRPTQLFAGTMIGSFWGAEVGYLSTGRMLRDGVETRVQGVNFSLVGRARFGSSLGVFGKVGTVYGHASPLASASSASGSEGFGLSFGGGVSYDITPRLSARIEWDSNDFRFAGGRDPVRSTSLGLQYRY